MKSYDTDLWVDGYVGMVVRQESSLELIMVGS